MTSYVPRARRHAHSAHSLQMNTPGVEPSSAIRRPDLPQQPHDGTGAAMESLTAAACRSAGLLSPPAGTMGR